MDTPQRPAEASGPGPWLRRLCDQAQDWARKAHTEGAEPNQTSAYIDLSFSFGLARLGERDASRELLQRAETALTPRDEAHRLLLAAFEYRIGQAVEGKPHTGMQPAELIARLQNMGEDNEAKMRRYVIDRLRSRSRILEPVQKVDPYARYTARSSELDRALADLSDLTDKQKLADGVQKLLRETPRGAKGNDHRIRVLKVGLELAPRVGEDFGRELLSGVLVAYDALPQPQDRDGVLHRAMLLEQGLTTATHFTQREWIHPLMDRVKQLLRSPLPSVSEWTLASLIPRSLRDLRALGLHDQIDGLLGPVIDCLGVKSLELDRLPKTPIQLRVLLSVAGAWFSSGRERQAEPILEAARGVLFTGAPDPINQAQDLREFLPLASAYAETVGQTPVEEMQRRLEELFARLPGIRDSFRTDPWYFVSQLQVIEAAVWAVVDHEEPPLVIDNR